MLDLYYSSTFNVAIINILISTRGQITVCNVKDVHRVSSPVSAAPLRFTERFMIFQLIVLALLSTSVLAAEGRSFHVKSTAVHYLPGTKWQMVR